MLVIRKKQFEALKQCPLDTFKKRLLQYFISGDSEYGSGLLGYELQDLISKGVEKAQSYGIVDGEDIKNFIEYMIVKGSDFDEKDERAKAILTNTEFDGEERIEELDIYFNGLDED